MKFRHKKALRRDDVYHALPDIQGGRALHCDFGLSKQVSLSGNHKGYGATKLSLHELYCKNATIQQIVNLQHKVLYGR